MVHAIALESEAEMDRAMGIESERALGSAPGMVGENRRAATSDFAGFVMARV
jgi:hypothetical protein